MSFLPTNFPACSKPCFHTKRQAELLNFIEEVYNARYNQEGFGD